MTVRIRQTAVDDIVDHARAELPNECCGLLVGTADEVAWSVRASNLRQSPTRFLIDPVAHFAALKRAREAGLSVIGAYHSHPGTAASPSETDLEEVSEPGFLHLIVSLRNAGTTPEVRAFRVAGGNFRPVELVPVV